LVESSTQGAAVRKVLQPISVPEHQAPAEACSMVPEGLCNSAPVEGQSEV
jgi:hypothetical protein